MRITKDKLGWVFFVAALASIGVLRSTGRLHFGAEASDLEGESNSVDGGETDGGHIVGSSVVLDADTAQALRIETLRVALGSIASALRVPGEVRLAEDRTAHVTPRIPGTIRSIQKNIGDAVTAGEAVCVVDSTELGQAKADYALSSAEFTIAERNVELWRRLEEQGYKIEAAAFAPSGWVDLDQAWAEHVAAVSEASLAERLFERSKELNARGLKTTTELWSAESEALKTGLHVESAERRLAVLGVVANNALARARVQVEASKGSLRAMGLTDLEIADVSRPSGPAEPSTLNGLYAVKSSIAGFVLDRHATLGEFVGPEDHAFLVGDLSEVWVQASIHDRDISSVREGMAARASVLGAQGNGFAGRVGLVGRIVDESTRTLLIRVVVKNPSSDVPHGDISLRPGMFATVDLELERRDGVIAIPLSALMTVDGANVVFVRAQLAGSATGRNEVAFEKRAVEIGLRDGRSVEIQRGIAVGDEVVVANAYLLKSEFERSRMEAD